MLGTEIPSFLPCSGFLYSSSLGSSYGVGRAAPIQAPIPARQPPPTSALSQALLSFLTHFFGLQRCPILPFSDLFPCSRCLPQHWSFSLTNPQSCQSVTHQHFLPSSYTTQSSSSHGYPPKNVAKDNARRPPLILRNHQPCGSV